MIRSFAQRSWGLRHTVDLSEWGRNGVFLSGSPVGGPAGRTFLGLFTVVVWCILSLPAVARDVPRVVILNSYHPGFAWSDAEISGFADRMQEVYPDFDAPIEYLDARRYPDQQNLQRMRNFVLEKYRDKPVNLVVCLDNPALDMLLHSRGELFVDVPVVFAGINDFSHDMLNGYPGMTGIAAVADIKGTLEIALDLHPQANHILIVNDNTLTGMAMRKAMEATDLSLLRPIDMRFLPPVTFDEAVAELSSLPQDSLVLILSFHTDRLGMNLPTAESTRIFTSATRMPVYAVHVDRLGHGIVGGLLLDGRDHGRRAANMAQRILAGENPAAIPVDARATAKPMFDYVPLKRMGISLSALPQDSIVVNRPVSVFESHREFVLGTLTVIAILAALVAMLAPSMVRRRRAEIALRESELKFRTVVQNADAIIFILDRNGVFLLSEGRALEKLGLAPGEVVGLSALDFYANIPSVSEGIRKALTGELARISAEVKSIIFDTVYSPRYNVQGKIDGVIGIAVDITERKRMEEALQRTQFSVDHATDAVYWVGEDGGLVYANDTACSCLGYTREELLSMTVFDIDPRFPREYWADHWKKTIDKGSRIIQTEHKAKDGRVFPVEIAINVMHFNGVAYHCAYARDITERKLAEKALCESEYFLRKSQEVARLGSYCLDFKTGQFLTSEKINEIFGIDDRFPKNVNGWLSIVHPDQRDAAWQHLNQHVLEQKHSFDMEYRIQRHSDGQERWVHGLGELEFDANGHPIRMIGTLQDITDEKRAEQEKAKLELQLNHALKMESIGRLAGGVAHDFNNMLSVILGYTEIIKMRSPEDDPNLKDILEIEKAAIHSRDITRQLLAFSRKQILSPRPLQLNQHITETRKTLTSLIGEDILLQFLPGEDLWTIRFDPSQLDQILMNLAVNARHAMPDGGWLTIVTANVVIDEMYCSEHFYFTPGEYVLLEISDQGIGMDKETLSHVFEPFFTTKAVGVGTGLGLATVYGIVKQCGGFINVYSEPGQGTTFKIHVPRSTDAEPVKGAQETPVPAGSETVMLVEDAEPVRKLVSEILDTIGYKVLAVETPQEALALVEKGDTPIDVLLTDVVMPDMNGVELRDRICAIRPGIKVLFMSGYTADVIAQRGVIKEGIHFIQKPFSVRDIGRKLREVLGDPHAQ